ASAGERSISPSWRQTGLTAAYCELGTNKRAWVFSLFLECIMATATTKSEDQETAAPETSDSPVLDLMDAAVKRLIKLAKSRGYVTYDELNEVLPPDEVSPDQIEDIMTMFSDLGVNVVDAEEVEEAAAAEPIDDDEEERQS